MICLSLLKLSQEVIDEIVDSVDQESLANCALAHRVFRHRSQSRLFSTIKFSSNLVQYGQEYLQCRHKRIEAFRDMLHDAPHIARYVRGLSLKISTFDNSWVAEETVFIELLDLLKRTGSRIETLILMGISFPEKLCDTRLLEQHFLRPFIFPSLKTLVISGMISIPMSLISNSPKLQNLTTFHSSVEDFGNELDLLLVRCSPKIRHLHYLPPDSTIQSIIIQNMKSSQGKRDFKVSDLDPEHYGTIFLDSMDKYECDLPPIADLAELRSVTTVIRYLGILENVIQISRHFLEELHLLNYVIHSDENLGYRNYNLVSSELLLAKHINLSGIPRLRAFSVDVVFPSPSSKREPLEDICNVLQTISTENCIEVITLKIFIGFESSASDPLSATQGDWGRLDSEITRIACQKHLHLRLQITYQMPESEYEDSDDEDEDYVLYKEREKICGDVLRKLAEESFPNINTISSISLDFTYSILPD